MILASWVHSEQQRINEFYRAELDAVMKAQGKKRLLLTDDQRRLLAVKGKSLGRKTLMELTTIVTPDTIGMLVFGMLLGLRCFRRMASARPTDFG